MLADDFLTVALLQTDIVWEDKQANYNKIESLIGELAESVDLIVAPEMFVTGFSMNTKRLAEDAEGKTVRWMQSVAGHFQVCFAGSLMITSGEHVHNRFVFVFPDGKICYYDKRHLFSMGLENQSYSSGRERLIIKLKGFRILPQVCYDLRFPVFSRNRDDYDLLLNCANWPASRIDVWNVLLRARAIENQAFVAAVNRTGTDANGIRYNGGSCILDARGTELAKSSSEKEQVLIARLSKISLEQFRKKFPVLSDRDEFSIQI